MANKVRHQAKANTIPVSLRDKFWINPGGMLCESCGGRLIPIAENPDDRRYACKACKAIYELVRKSPFVAKTLVFS